MYFPTTRLRRLRENPSLRSMLQETFLRPEDFIYPIFILEEGLEKSAIASLPGLYRWSLKELELHLEPLIAMGLKAIAPFPVIDDKLKSSKADEALNPKGLYPQLIARLKERFPELLIYSDVALDPYSSDGHDGIMVNGKILNDESVQILKEMAILHARSGADFVAPSDMMDGRVKVIRSALDAYSLEETGILAYSAKFASAYYGPFRDALDSQPRSGDKKSYQLSPSNRREAIREALLDMQEGADILMVKPALAYLDIIRDLRERCDLPLAAYNVSGEYTMAKLGAEHAGLNETAIIEENLSGMKRAGADIILTYHAPEIIQTLYNRGKND